MSPNRDRERTVPVYRGSNVVEVESVAQGLREAGITCSIQGAEIASTFAGLTALDGVAMMSVVVFESDEAQARAIVDRFLKERPFEQQADDA